MDIGMNNKGLRYKLFVVGVLFGFAPYAIANGGIDEPVYGVSLSWSLDDANFDEPRVDITIQKKNELELSQSVKFSLYNPDALATRENFSVPMSGLEDEVITPILLVVLGVVVVSD